jgi:hypothetical protein
MGLLFLFVSCGVYNFTGGDVGSAKTYRVDFFQNYAAQSPGSTVDPGLDRDFTLSLQDQILNQSTLSLVPPGSPADLIYQGEITEYRVSPMTATAEQQAAQNRLKMSVKVRFFNNTPEAKDGKKDFERTFSFFYDFPAGTQLITVRDEAHQAIFERINQDIFNASLADW